MATETTLDREAAETPETATAPTAPEEPSRFRSFAWPIAIVCLVACATTATLVVMNRSAIHSFDDLDTQEVIIPIGFAVIGAILASRRSRNPVGWIFLGIAFFVAVAGIATQYTLRSTRISPLPATSWVV